MGASIEDRRRVALAKLGWLFAEIDRAITKGDFGSAKVLLLDVNGCLAEARATVAEDAASIPRESEFRALRPHKEPKTG